MKNSSKTNYLIFFKYISTIISWTIFVLLSIIGALLIYYFVSSKLYVTKGDKYEPVFSIYTIVSGSMEPTIKVYDVIINTKVNDPKDVKINDVITFTSTSDISSGKTVTHRVIGVREMDDGSTCYVTRGDNNTTEDPSCATYSNLIGKVSAVIPGLGRIQFFLASKFGWLFIIAVPALYIIIKDLFKLFKMSRKKEETTDNIDNTMVISNLIKRNNEIDEIENNNNEFVTKEESEEVYLPVVMPSKELKVIENKKEEITKPVEKTNNSNNNNNYNKKKKKKKNKHKNSNYVKKENVINNEVKEENKVEQTENYIKDSEVKKEYEPSKNFYSRNRTFYDFFDEKSD